MWRKKTVIAAIVLSGFVLTSSYGWGTGPTIRVLINTNKSRPVVKTLSIEKYVPGVLVGELPKDWPIEALKAQAVAARTYAIATLAEKEGGGSPYDVESTVADQVFSGKTFGRPDVDEAVSSTAGEILTYHNKPIKARFHSSCGGKTETSIRVWGEQDISRGINDPYCKGSPHNSWQTTLTATEIESALKKLGFNIGKIQAIKLEEFDSGGRVAAVSIHGDNQTVSLTGNDFRRYLGFSTIKSTKFNVSQSGYKFTFIGKGFGHGVGMCQWGARGMALAGKNYREILEFYYPGTRIKKFE